jgi:hypothetical protein
VETVTVTNIRDVKPGSILVIKHHHTPELPWEGRQRHLRLLTHINEELKKAGICGVTILSATDAVDIETLPYKDIDRIVSLWLTNLRHDPDIIEAATRLFQLVKRKQIFQHSSDVA